MSYKKEIFDSYAVAVAKQFHLNLDEMFNKNNESMFSLQTFLF